MGRILGADTVSNEWDEGGPRWEVGNVGPRGRHGHDEPMFYGTPEHTIDDKNRPPACKFRDGLGGGVVLVRGIDGTVDVYPRTSWEASAERISALDSLTREAREMKRFVFAGAAVTEIDKQGRVLVPPDLARHASLGRDVAVVVSTTTSRSGTARSGRTTSARSKGASEMLPNVQRTDAA